MPHALSIRSMHEADLEEICALEIESAGGWTRSQLYEESKRPGAWQLVGQLPGTDRIVSYIFGVTVLDEAEIFRFVVLPRLRRQGIGLHLLKLTIDRLRQNGVKSLFLEVRESNRAALSLYRKEGFGEIGKRKKYYTNPLEDAIIMRRELSPP